MDSTAFTNFLATAQTRWQTYVRTSFGKRAGEISLRFIDTNFKTQGYQGGGAWPPNKRKGTILIKTGNLRRGNHYVASPGMARVYNNAQSKKGFYYGRVHNEGFTGSVQIPEHQRRSLQSTKVKTGRIRTNGRAQTLNIDSCDLLSILVHTIFDNNALAVERFGDKVVICFQS